jgi:tetratricopeptide (TPR) repeat protein
LAQELLHALSRIEQLKVIAPTSAFSFSGKGVEVREIGRILNVAMVLEGSIRRSKNKVRITVDLVSANDGFQFWSERYDRQVCEIVDVQSEIALAVVQALELTLSETEKSAVCKRHTQNPKAHQRYLKARFHAGRFTPEGLRSAIEYFNRAIAEDPQYALAYAGLAEVYYQLFCTHQTPPESLAQVKAAGEKALELDKDLADAETLLGVVAANCDRMPHEAEKRFQRALALAPNNLLAHRSYGSYLMAQGRLAAAIAEFCRARELDPLSPVLSVLISNTYFLARQPHQALKHARKALAIDENFWLGHWSAALAYEQSGQLIEALGQLEKAGERDSSSWITASRARVYARLGRREITAAILEELEKKARTEWVSPYMVATVYFALDENDRGFEWLEKAYDNYDESLNCIAVCPLMDPYRSDPRFNDLLSRTGLDQCNATTHFVVPVTADCFASGRLTNPAAS